MNRLSKLSCMLERIAWCLKALCNIIYGLAYFSAVAFSHIVCICSIVMMAIGTGLNEDITTILCMSVFLIVTHWSLVSKRLPIPFPFKVTEKFDWLPKVTWCAVLFSINSLSFAQVQKNDSIYVDGTKIVQMKNVKKSNIVLTKYCWTIINGDKEESYDVYINTNSGRCLYYKVSKKTGNKYPVYLPEDYAKQIANEMHIVYTPPKKKL